VTLEDSKTGPRTRQLGRPAEQVLAGPEKGGPKASVFVFQGQGPNVAGVD
jgi:hypothetical protein